MLFHCHLFDEALKCKRMIWKYTQSQVKSSRNAEWKMFLKYGVYFLKSKYFFPSFSKMPGMQKYLFTFFQSLFIFSSQHLCDSVDVSHAKSFMNRNSQRFEKILPQRQTNHVFRNEWPEDKSNKYLTSHQSVRNRRTTLSRPSAGKMSLHSLAVPGEEIISERMSRERSLNMNIYAEMFFFLVCAESACERSSKQVFSRSKLFRASSHKLERNSSHS